MSASPSPREANARVLDRELAWLKAAMDARFAAYHRGDARSDPPLPPSLARARGAYAETLRRLDLAASTPARLLLALALAPHVQPALLDPFLLQNRATKRRFTEFGGVLGQAHAGVLPTLQTALFLLAGTDRRARLLLEPLLPPNHPLLRHDILAVERREPEEPPSAAALRLTPAGLHALTEGGIYAPPPGAEFPASPLSTPLAWEDLVLDRATAAQVELISTWIAQADTLMQDWGLARRLKPGFRCLFHGGPGTGKTVTAGLLGKRHGVPVYRVDISQVVSKWIGETEKNLATLFDRAADRDWILFFDEADALFGKRTDAGSANDRAANQQIAYLLQRLEDHPGVAILATNQHDHLDEAFARRFQIAIHFPMPGPAARERLWRETFAGDGFALAEDVDFARLAGAHELAGGAIVNVLRYAALMAVRRRPPVIHAHDLIDGIRRERRKEGRYVG